MQIQADSLLLTKLATFSISMKQKRSWNRIGEKYAELIGE